MTGSLVNIEKAERRDPTLVALAEAGNPPAIDQVIRKYWPHAYRTAARILRCHADAEEAPQDVLFSAVSHLELPSVRMHRSAPGFIGSPSTKV